MLEFECFYIASLGMKMGLLSVKLSVSLSEVLGIVLFVVMRWSVIEKGIEWLSNRGLGRRSASSRCVGRKEQNDVSYCCPTQRPAFRITFLSSGTTRMKYPAL